MVLEAASPTGWCWGHCVRGGGGRSSVHGLLCPHPALCASLHGDCAMPLACSYVSCCNLYNMCTHDWYGELDSL